MQMLSTLNKKNTAPLSRSFILVEALGGIAPQSMPMRELYIKIRCSKVNVLNCA